VYPKAPVLRASVGIDASLERVREWFLSLDEHPERYEFGTHSGFVFTKGSFGDEGAQFETREQFAGVRIRLRFQLMDVDQRHFTFRLLEPPLAVWGAFEMEPALDSGSRLSLLIDSESRWARGFLRLPLIHGAVLRQIQREVSHIKESLERLYAT
jgi:hypothetical protein